MQEILKEQTATVQQLSSEIKSAENHFMLKQAIAPLRLVLGFMRNVVRIAINQQSRLKALESAKCASFEPVNVCPDCNAVQDGELHEPCTECRCYHVTIKCKHQLEGVNHAE